MEASAESGVSVAPNQYESGSAGSIILLGTSFKTAPIGFRECFASHLLSNGVLRTPLANTVVTESSIIETCNRVELYLVATDPKNAVESVLAGFDDGSADNLYQKTGLEAVNHIFRVSSGLDSLVVGEEQILRQVRAAGRRARVAGDAKSILSSLFDAAYNAGERARGLYGISSPGESVSSFALRFGLERLGRRPKKVLLMGTGETAKLAMMELSGAKIYLFSRRLDAGARFSTTERVPHDRLKEVAAECDLIIAATRHTGYLLKKGDLPDDRKRVLLDLSFPRNIDPSMRSSDLIRLYDLDDLAAQARSLPKSEELAAGEKLLAAEAEQFNRWLMASRLTPTLPGIYRWAEAIREEEAQLALRRLSRLSERDRRVVEAMSRRLVSKLLAPHAAFAKQQGGGLSQADRLRLLESVFGGEEQT
jgi:glutamyl-tRNA reductase